MNLLNNKTTQSKPLLVFDGLDVLFDEQYRVRQCEDNKYRLNELIDLSYVRLLKTRYNICLQYGQTIQPLFR